MTSLSILLDSKTMLPLPTLNAIPKDVNQGLQIIMNTWPDIEDLEEDESAEELASRLRCCIRDSDWTEYYWHDLGRAAIAIFGTPSLREDFEDEIYFLIEQVHSKAKSSFLRTIFNLYLSTYNPFWSPTKRLSRALQKDDCWNQIHPPDSPLVHEFDVLNIPKNPHRKIGKYMFSSTGSLYEKLQDKGISSPHNTGLMEMAQLHYLELAADDIVKQKKERIQQLLDWLFAKPNLPLRGNSAKKAVDVLLQPWTDREPRSDIRELIEGKLCSNYGDPRIKETGVWSACSEDSKEVIHRWLTTTTFNLFFQIIGEGNDSHMWPEREKFWREILDEGRITAAHFVLSRAAESHALSIKEKEEGISLVYGKNISPTKEDRKKSLLLLKVDGKLVIEGTHIFAVRIFPDNTNIEEHLYKKEYSCEEVRQTHNSLILDLPRHQYWIPHNGDWQSRVRLNLH